MWGILWVSLVLAAVPETERVQADAVAVLSSVLKTLESAAGVDRVLGERFDAWCLHIDGKQQSLADEVQRKASETTVALEQISADEERLNSENTLAASTLTATNEHRKVAEESAKEINEDVDAELAMLSRAAELSTHALRLVRNHKADAGNDLEDEPDIAAQATAEDPGLEEILSQLLSELDDQKSAADDEKTTVDTILSNLTGHTDIVTQSFAEAQRTVSTEGRERARAKARYASEAADLRRLSTAVEESATGTSGVCAAERELVHSRGGVASAEMDAVHTVLDQVSPDTEFFPTFTQLFMARNSPAQVSTGVRAQFRELVQRLGGSDAGSAFARASAKLASVADTALVAAKTERSKSTVAADALSEIASFGADNGEETAEDKHVAEEAYHTLISDLKKQIHENTESGKKCEARAAQSVQALHERKQEAAFAVAKLADLNTTTLDLSKEANYLSSELQSVTSGAADFADLAATEGSEFKKTDETLNSFAQQLLSVTTELSGIGEKKSAKSVESLVERLQGHSAYIKRRHQLYSDWSTKVKHSLDGLDRVLVEDFHHASHKVDTYQTETTFLGTAHRAKERDEVLAKEDSAHVFIECPPEKEAARVTHLEAMQAQLREVDSFWNSMRY